MADRIENISVDTGRCCGSGMCAITAPEIFAQDEETGLVVLLQEQPSVELAEIALNAELACPTNAIHLQLASPPSRE